ncbi:MAG: DUF4296 domain-containing protein [Bacteroidales bacterium]|nr:DUF4296 domain-containing protein [Candidatus Liminaster caballi]
MRRFILYIAVATAMICVLGACNSRPKHVIDEETMTALLTDVHLAEGLIDVQDAQNRERPEYGQEVMAAVLLKHGITKEQYDTSLVWYSQNLKKLIRIYNHVEDNLKQQNAEWLALSEMNDTYGPCEPGDSIDLWRNNRHQLLDEERLTAHRIWTIPADTTFHKGDTLRWSLHIPQQMAGQGIVASMALVNYDEKSKTYSVYDGCGTGLLSADTLLVLTCKASDDVELSRIIMSLNVRRTADSIVLKPTYVDDVELMRLHQHPQN